jgi:DNA repair exonuclease SbcCD nuclease subunit
MKILIYSDLHLHNHHKLIVNSETALGVLSYIKEYAQSNDIKKIISAGDFFHTKAKTYAPHVIQGWLKVKEIKKANIDQYMLIGNHDMANPNTTMNSILFVYSDYVKVIPDYYFFDTENTRYHLLSYTDTKFDNFQLDDDKYNVLIAHLDIIGFQMSNGFQSISGFKMEDFKDFDLVLSGHYHKHQQKNNIVYIGSPYQTSFSERGQKKGFIILDDETLDWEFVETPEAPKYEIIDISSLDDLSNKNVNNKFLKIRLKNNKINKTKLKDRLVELGAISTNIVMPEDTKEIEKYYEDELSADPVELATSYINSLSSLQRLDKRKLVKYFNKIQEVADNITEYEL